MRPAMIDGAEEPLSDFYAALLIGFHGRWGMTAPNSSLVLPEVPPHCWLPNGPQGVERLRAHMQAEHAALERGRAAIRVAREELTQMVEQASGRDRHHFDASSVPCSMTEALGTPGMLSPICHPTCE